MGANLRFSGFCGINRFQIGCVFAEYDLFKPKLYIYEFSYNFDTVLYQFLETGTSDRCFIVQRLRFSDFSLYHLSFFLYNPFKDFLLRACKLNFAFPANIFVGLFVCLSSINVKTTKPIRLNFA